MASTSSPVEGPEMQSASSYTNLPYLFGDQDPSRATIKPKPPRRKIPHGSDQVKHRRTRSGCYTCRNRRVKCDETHPMCNRCRKANRICEYPSNTNPTRTTVDSSHATGPEPQQALDTDSDDSDDHGGHSHLEAIADEHEDDFNALTQATSPTQDPSASSSQGVSPRSDNEVPGFAKYHQAIGGQMGTTGSSMASPVDEEGLRSDWSHLPSDLQFYLRYFYDNITCYHYSMKSDPNNFLKTYFLDAALRNDALLNAVVGFSAYQYLLQRKSGKIEAFLQYYNKAVSLLLRTLKAGEQHSVTTILTMLQLATIEEYLGDWVNLFGHQKAAYKILTELYSPATIMRTPLTRSVLHWYTRFDIIAGLLAGIDTILSREWSVTALEFYQYNATQEPENLTWKVEVLFADIRLIAIDMSNNFAQIGRGQIDFAQFLVENAVIGRRLADWKTQMPTAISNPQYKIMDFSKCAPVHPESIVDPYKTGILYRQPLWAMNHATIDWSGVDLMHRFQTAAITQQQITAADTQQAFDVCQMLEAVDCWHDSPRSIILTVHTCLSLAALFLPRDDRHMMWVRRKLAKAESAGYIFPPTYRKKFAELFRDPSCLKWWLPNDEGYSTAMRAIREFVDERSSVARDVSSEGLRDMKTVFSVLQLNDSAAEAAS